MEDGYPLPFLCARTSISSLFHTTKNILYHIFYSGLTDKTKLAFTSSNSSFSECLTTTIKHLLPRSSSSDSNTDCTSSYEGCLFYDSNPLPDSLSSSASFSQCIFLKLSSYTNGGAISFSNKASGTLTISHCSFYSCSCSRAGGEQDGNGGGAIYSSDVSTVEICSSSFISCACDGYNGCDGGAIELWIITSYPLLSQCNFLFCHANDDGGSLSIWKANANNHIVCTDSSFLHGYSGDGGGAFTLWDNSELIKGSNLLFCNNHCSAGGAYENNACSTPPDYLLSFCFFQGNTATYGSDASLPCASSDDLFFHCFSNSEETRIYPGNHEDWLPQANINNKLSSEQLLDIPQHHLSRSHKSNTIVLYFSDILLQ